MGRLSPVRAAALAVLLAVCLPRHASAQGSGADPLDAGLAALRARRYADAREQFEEARRRSPRDPEVALLLGIACYRLGLLDRAEPLLTEAARDPDPDLQAAARLFLGLVYQARGAADRAHRELERAAASQPLSASARGIAEGLRPRRLTGSLLLSPEYDGNVPLTDLAAWRRAPAESSDGVVLLLGSLTARPLLRLGLQLGATLSYRQPFRLQRYRLLLGTAWAGYSYLGERHRLRATASFTYSLFDSSTFYVEGEARASYRLRLGSSLGVTVSYTARYRAYQQDEFSSFTGHSHIGQLDVGWSVVPDPVQVAVGYQVQRDELRPGAAPADDFRATAHGPVARLRARLHKRLELAALGMLLSRTFDVMPAPGGRRQDLQVGADLSLDVVLTRWLECFVGAALLYNQSTDDAFTFVRPMAYGGLSAGFAAL